MGIELVNQNNGAVVYESYFFQLAIPRAYEEVYSSGPGIEKFVVTIRTAMNAK